MRATHVTPRAGSPSLKPQPAPQLFAVGPQPAFCVRCSGFIDVFAQWLCDECRMLPLSVVIWGMPLVEGQ